MILRHVQYLALIYGSEQHSAVKVQLDRIQKEGVQMSTETATQFTYLRQELDQAVKALLETKDKARPNADEENIYPSTNLCSTLSRLQSMSKSLSRENQILRRLYFDNIYAREDTIADAESGTFKWILEEDEDKSIHSIAEHDDGSIYSAEENYEISLDSSEGSMNSEDILTRGSLANEDEIRAGPSELQADSESALSVQVEIEPDQGEERQIEIQDFENTPQSPTSSQEAEQRRIRAQTRDSFLRWLRSENQIYQISGKAGSGKSTLMKFLSAFSGAERIEKLGSREKISLRSVLLLELWRETSNVS